MNKLTIQQFVEQVNNDNLDYALASDIVTGYGTLSENDQQEQEQDLHAGQDNYSMNNDTEFGIGETDDLNSYTGEDGDSMGNDSESDFDSSDNEELKLCTGEAIYNFMNNDPDFDSTFTVSNVKKMIKVMEEAS